MSRRALGLLVAACLVVGLVLMIGFSAPLTRVLGVACLVGFVAAGVFLAADPAFLARDGDR